jgi:hypothetical protein
MTKSFSHVSQHYQYRLLSPLQNAGTSDHHHGISTQHKSQHKQTTRDSMVQLGSRVLMPSPEKAALSKSFPRNGAQHPNPRRRPLLRSKISKHSSILFLVGFMVYLLTLAQYPTRAKLQILCQQVLVDGDAPKEPSRNTPPEERCAINFFGLPRAFQSLVLPSIIENVIRPNAAHNCDYFVHYFNLTQEAAGRSGKGGHLNTSEILLLEQHVQREAPPGQRRPKVVFLAEQEEDFWKKYEALINKTRDTKDSKGRFLYYPWKDKSYEYPGSVDNIIKMWHSIQSAWLLMEQHATEDNIQYSRVAMLRADVMYVSSIDIYRLDNDQLDNDHNNDTDANAGALFDHENRFAVVPSFAKFPVNDRMIYGPHAAVKIWAAERFARLETHVQSILKDDPGYGMHSERFLNHTIFPAIRQAGIEIHDHPHMCFFRVRTDETVWVSDCDPRAQIKAERIARIVRIKKKKKVVEGLIGRQCGKVTRLIRSVRTMDCKSHES